MQTCLKQGRRISFSIIIMVASVLLVYGCTGPTSVSPQGGSADYSVDIKMDPVTLNPPQLGTLNFQVTDNKTNKVVSAFDPVAAALLHNVIIGKNLEFFRHDSTQNLVLNQASVAAYFPKQGTYYTYSLYKPAGAPIQTFKSTIVSGTDSVEPQLTEETKLIKTTNGLGVAWVKGTGAIRAGQQTQLLFHITERGDPVTSLWLNYSAPAHLWLVDQAGNEFTHLMGLADSRALLPNATPGEGTTQSSGSSSEPITVEVPVGGGTMTPVPTLFPSLSDALATVTAAPFPTLLPVQKTAGAGLTGTQLVRPAVGYGPDVVFTHTFPHDGFYKMWLELKWQDEVVTTDFVVKVDK